jgi:tRNA G37 N-methylase Trm5
MPNPLPLTAQAHQIIEAKLDKTAIAIDATAGNGHDTLFLAKRAKQVFAFDIQAQAISNTRQRLEQAKLLEKVCLFQNGHQHMRELIPAQYHGQITAIMFNLGYLPGADKQLITQPDTTLEAVNAALRLLQKHGIISLMVYPGHPGGEQEHQQLKSWLHQNCASKIAITIIQGNLPRPESPVLYILEKLTTS